MTMSEAPSQPVDGPIENVLQELYGRLKCLTDGSSATYIPELATAQPESFGLSVATLDGHVYGAGDWGLPFTIQSISKPFVYALALADRGIDAVHKYVGVEPTGDSFNSITVDAATGRPFNPMVNAGAIVTTSLVSGDDRTQQFNRIRQGLSVFAGRDLDVDIGVFASEQATGDRNRAIAYLIRTFGLLDEDVKAMLDVYFEQCSILVTCRDLAVMAATLANAGVNPVTAERAMPAADVAHVLTVMSTCGMYDYAGEWLFRVGLPAKSGVSGGITAVLPGQLGIGLYSPLLDARGNSVRGIAACQEFSSVLALHLFHPRGRPPSGLRRSYRADIVRSRRSRTIREREVLARAGQRIVVHELQGDQTFATVENLIRAVRANLDAASWVILDFRRVGQVNSAAQKLLDGLVRLLADRDVATILADPHALPPLAGLSRVEGATVRRFADLDSALEWCEHSVLAHEGIDDFVPDAMVPLESQELLRNLPAESFAVVQSLLTTKVLTPGLVLFEEGDPADALYFVSAGQVSVDILVHDPRRRVRISTIPAGQAFGEMALIDGGTRSSRIVVDQPTLCHVLSVYGFNALRDNHPDIALILFQAIARSLSSRLRHANREIRALAD
jgi:glutaminase